MSDLVKFYICFGLLCLMFPPLIGLALGTAGCVAIWYFFYKFVFGGKG